MSTNDDPSREVAPTFPATLSPPTQHSLGSHTPRTELEGALTQHEAEQGRSSPSQQLAKSLVSTQPPPIPEKQAPAMKEDTAGLQDGDEAFLVRFCQVYRSMGSVSEQKTWGSNNASGCDSCAQRLLKCSAGENIRCGECSSAKRGCSRIARYRRDRTMKELKIDEATFVRLYRHIDSLPTAVVAPPKGDNRKSGAPSKRKIKKPLPSSPSQESPRPSPRLLSPTPSPTPGPSNRPIFRRRLHLSTGAVGPVVKAGTPRPAGSPRCRINMGTQTPLRHASERDHRQSHTVSIEAQLESLHNSSQEALHDKDVIIKKLQDQVDEMLRIEHNNLQVANLRLLQLRQQVAPGTPPERIVVTWHEDVLGELTKAYLTERLQTRSLFDVGWKRGRDEAKDEEEDLEAVDVSERISKRARLEEEGKGKEREEAV